MGKPLKQYEVLKWASSFLNKHFREDGIAEILLMHHLDISKPNFYQQMHAVLPGDVIDHFRQDIIRHAEMGVPVQHIIGYAPFYGRDFIVNEAVLIPRFETEELVEKVIQYITADVYGRKDLVLVDVGTGSGIIAITLKLAIPKLTVYATDVSEKALNVAKQNASLHHADVEFLQGDFLMAIISAGITPDLIVSNPPYISYADKEDLKDTVKDFDPELALFAEEDGLQAYKKIVSQSVMLAREKGKAFFFEIGSSQAHDVCTIINETYPNGELSIIKDMNNRDRIIIKKCD